MMTINSFSGESNGRGISFADNTLTISNVTHADALAIVASLGDGPAAAPAPGRTALPHDVARTGRTSAAAPNEATKPRAEEPDHAHGARRIGPPMPRVDEAAIASAAATSTPKPKAEPKPRRAPAAREEDAEVEEAAPAPAARTRRAAPAPEPDEETPDPAVIIEDEEDIPHAEAKSLKTNGANGHAKTNGTNGHATHAPADEVDPVLVNAKKLKDVLAYLLDKGITDVDDLKKKCNELKPSVPMLQRITSLDERIDRTLEVMNAGDEVS